MLWLPLRSRGWGTKSSSAFPQFLFEGNNPRPGHCSFPTKGAEGDDRALLSPALTAHRLPHPTEPPLGRDLGIGSPLAWEIMGPIGTTNVLVIPLSSLPQSPARRRPLAPTLWFSQSRFRNVALGPGVRAAESRVQFHPKGMKPSASPRPASEYSLLHPKSARGFEEGHASP